MKINIAEPCHEKWDAMTPNEVGKHCAVCEKTVHDFTDKSKEELLAFMLCSEQKPCIRMLVSQQNFTPEEVQSTAQRLLHSGISIPAAALSLVMLFATACGTDNPQVKAQQSLSSPDTTITQDTIAPYPEMMGMVLPAPPPSDTPDVVGKVACPPSDPEGHPNNPGFSSPVVVGEPAFPAQPEVLKNQKDSTDKKEAP